MRSLFTLLALLVLANIVVYWWPDKANYAPHVYAAFVRLNKEIEEKFYSQEIIIDDQENDKTPAPLVSNVSPSQACYRIGPFMHQENFELAQAVLFNAEIVYRKTKRASKASDVFRVFLGPYQSQAEVSDARVDLKRRKVLDHFVRKQDDDTYIISLGIYSTSDSADTAIRLFDGKLDAVQKQSELVVLPDSFWLQFVMEKESRVRQQLSVMDWGEQSAKMGLHPCDAEL